MTIDDGNLIRNIDLSPAPVRQFFNKYGGPNIMAAFEDYDIPIYGAQSEWDVKDHQNLLGIILEFDRSELEEFVKTSISDDDIDYMQPYYGADGDILNIEEDYNARNMYEEWWEVVSDITLYQAIHAGFVSQQWLRAAKSLNIDLDNKNLIRSIEKEGYSLIQELINILL